LSGRLRQVGALPPRAYPCARASACFAGHCARSSCFENLTSPSGFKRATGCVFCAVLPRPLLPRHAPPKCKRGPSALPATACLPSLGARTPAACASPAAASLLFDLDAAALRVRAATKCVAAAVAHIGHRWRTRVCFYLRLPYLGGVRDVCFASILRRSCCVRLCSDVALHARAPVSCASFALDVRFQPLDVRRPVRVRVVVPVVAPHLQVAPPSLALPADPLAPAFCVALQQPPHSLSAWPRHSYSVCHCGPKKCGTVLLCLAYPH
jgi:hypothetical protein